MCCCIIWSACSCWTSTSWTRTVSIHSSCEMLSKILLLDQYSRCCLAKCRDFLYRLFILSRWILHWCFIVRLLNCDEHDNYISDTRSLTNITSRSVDHLFDSFQFSRISRLYIDLRYILCELYRRWKSLLCFISNTSTRSVLVYKFIDHCIGHVTTLRSQMYLQFDAKSINVKTPTKITLAFVFFFHFKPGVKEFVNKDKNNF